MRKKFASVFFALLLTACGEGPRPRTEDQTRTVAPVPACIAPLPARRDTSTLRRLRDDETWRLVLPNYDPTKGAGDATTCTGVRLDKLPEMSSARPRKASIEDLVYGSGADRLKVVWLRTHSFEDGTDGGPIAVIRPIERFAELFGVGAYRGRADRVRFTVPRVSTGFVVAAEDDGCKSRKPTEGCEATTTIFLPRNGALLRAAEISIEHYKYVPANEKGTTGILELHGQTSVQYMATGISLTEVVEIHDDKGRSIRRLEGERTMTLNGDAFVPSEPPLWDKVSKR